MCGSVCVGDSTLPLKAPDKPANDISPGNIYSAISDHLILNKNLAVKQHQM